MDGAWIATPPLQSVDVGNTELLGTYTTKALDCSKMDVPHPTEFKSLIAPLLALADARTWAQFVRGTLVLGVKSSDSQIILTPYANKGSTGGFANIPGSEVHHVISNDPLQLGNWIIEAFGKCI